MVIVEKHLTTSLFISTHLLLSLLPKSLTLSRCFPCLSPTDIRMDIYDRLGSQMNPAYGKPAGFITAEVVASRFHGEIKDMTVLFTGCGLLSQCQLLAWSISHHASKFIIICGCSDFSLRLLASNNHHHN